MMGRTFKCMFFILNDLLFLLQEKKRMQGSKPYPVIQAEFGF